MQLPTIRIPLSRKVVGAAVASGVFALLRTIGVVETPPDVTAWIATGAGMIGGFVVGESERYLDYAARRLGLPVDFDVTD